MHAAPADDFCNSDFLQLPSAAARGFPAGASVAAGDARGVAEQKWDPRLANGQIEIIGEHGVDLPLQMLKVAKIEPFVGACPPELLDACTTASA